MAFERKIHPLVIFEGPDGGGKSTTVQAVASRMGDSTTGRIHHGPYSRVAADQLPRVYLDHMLPMLQGYQGQVWDRCWLSEYVYGTVYRNGQVRIDDIRQRHLERFALRHGAVVVLCMPPLETVLETFRSRKGIEMLDNEEQLKQVYALYRTLPSRTHLPVVHYDYTTQSIETLITAIHQARAKVGQHREVRLWTGGSATARVALVGEKPSELTSQDTIVQLPFASMSETGCSSWLTANIAAVGVREDQLFWVNASDNTAILKHMHLDRVFALGAVAAKNLETFGISHIALDHPQHHKRFKSQETYPLQQHLNDYFNA